MVKNDVWRYPSGKAAFDKAMLNEKGRGLWKDHNVITWNDMVFYFYPLTKERIEELKEVLEDARFVPIRTKPILDIICKEAAGYFGGGKSINETIDVINNRVQVYLDERQG